MKSAGAEAPAEFFLFDIDLAKWNRRHEFISQIRGFMTGCH